MPELNRQLAQARQHLDRATAAIRAAEEELAKAEALIRMTLRGTADQSLPALVAHNRQQLTTIAQGNAESIRKTDEWTARINGTAGPGKP